MSDTLLINVGQANGESNTVRLFFNEEFLDEFDTSTQPEIKNYEVDIVDGDINFIYVEVKNTITIVDDNRSNNILSSNSVSINELSLHQKNKDVLFSTNIESPLLCFKRKIDPIYEIYCKQKNITYHRLIQHNQKSSGDGIFALFWLPIHRYSNNPKILNGATPGMINHYEINILEQNPFFISGYQEGKKPIFKDDPIINFDTGKLIKTEDEAVKSIKERLSVKRITNLSENIELNIRKMYRFYED